MFPNKMHPKQKKKNKTKQKRNLEVNTKRIIVVGA
jgi:hypothetical protein